MHCQVANTTGKLPQNLESGKEGTSSTYVEAGKEQDWDAELEQRLHMHVGTGHLEAWDIRREGSHCISITGLRRQYLAMWSMLFASWMEDWMRVWEIDTDASETGKEVAGCTRTPAAYWSTLICAKNSPGVRYSNNSGGLPTGHLVGTA